MDTQTRQNIITWFKKDIRAPYRRLVSQEYPFLAGLPADDDDYDLSSINNYFSPAESVLRDSLLVSSNPQFCAVPIIIPTNIG